MMKGEKLDWNVTGELIGDHGESRTLDCLFCRATPQVPHFMKHMTLWHVSLHNSELWIGHIAESDCEHGTLCDPSSWGPANSPQCRTTQRQLLASPHLIRDSEAQPVHAGVTDIAK